MLLSQALDTVLNFTPKEFSALSDLLSPELIDECLVDTGVAFSSLRWARCTSRGQNCADRCPQETCHRRLPLVAAATSWNTPDAA